MKIIWVLFILTGLLLWYIPSTISIFSGTHSYYNINPNGSQISCTKCHGDISVELHTSYKHSNFTCEGCHRIETKIQYASGDGNNSTIPGTMAHAASIAKCIDCHSVFINNTPDIAHEALMRYGVKNGASDDCIACHAATAISINWTKPGATGIDSISNGYNTNITRTYIAYNTNIETFGNQSGDIIAVSNVTISY